MRKVLALKPFDCRISSCAKHGARYGKFSSSNIGRALCIKHVIVAEFRLDPVDWKNGMNRNGVIVSFQRNARSGERADDSDGLMFSEIDREDVIFVLEQDHGFACGAKSEFGMLGRIDFRVLDRRERDPLRRIEHAKLNARRKQAFEREVKLGLSDHTFMHSVRKGKIFRTTIRISAREDAGG